MRLTDAELVLKATVGDDKSFDELVSRYRTRIFYLVLGKIGSHELALDLSQDAFVQAYMSLKTLREPEKFAGWLTGIASNLCKMHLRKRPEQTLPIECIDSIHTTFFCPNDNALAIRSALDELSEATRAAAILYFVEEMKMSEIAQMLDIPLSSVKSRIRDARSHIRKEMVDLVRQTAKREVTGDEFNRGLAHKLELARWYREFSELIQSGTPIMSVLRKLREGNYSELVKAASAKLEEAIGSGKMMSSTLQELPALATPEALAMVRAGEIGGILEWTSRLLADWIEVEHAQRTVELSFWCRTFGAMLSAGVPISLTLDCGADIARSSDLKQAAKDMAQAISENSSIKTVMPKYSGLFPPVLQVAMLAGEYAGCLNYGLEWAGSYLACEVSGRLMGSGIKTPLPARIDMQEALIQGVLPFLTDDSAAFRAAAATILGQVEASNTATQITGLLTDSDREVRMAAIQALVDLGDCPESALPRCLQDPDSSVRRAVIQAVVDLGLHNAANDLAALISCADQLTSNAAVTALETMAETDILVKRGIELLEDDASINRVRAAHILNDHPSPKAVDALIKVLDDDVPVVRFYAALSLAKLGRKEALPTLLDFLTKSDKFLARDAARAILGLGEKSAAVHIKNAVELGVLDEEFMRLAEELEVK